VRLELSGTQEIEAPADIVWSRLLDHEFVAESAPGVESVEAVDAEHYRVVAGLGVGSMKLRFALQVELVDVEPPSKVRMLVRGNAPGSAMRAEADASLVPIGPRTSRLDWTVSSDVHGTIAGVGARVLQGTAGKLTRSFWKKFAKRTAAAAKKGSASRPASS
jgi:uncharacterized protein